ncbi:MAG: polysaccharide pyruvyl transferase family protein [Actinomycetota bacterium]
MTSPSRKILVLGTHGQANVGDELLLQTFLDQLGAHHRFEVNSYTPDETAESLSDGFDVEVFDTATTRVGLLAAIARCDALVFAGGSILKQLGPRTGRRPNATLLMILGVVTAARLMGRPILMSNIGVGPLPSASGRRLARRILRQVDLVSTRDPASYRLASELTGGDDKVIRVPDAAFANPPSEFGPPVGAPATDRAMRIALNLNRDVRDEAAWARFLDDLRRELLTLAARQRIEIVALPMQCRFKEDHDLLVLEDFLSTLPGVTCEFRAPKDAAEVAELIASCDVVLSERLHAIVIASVIGRPVIPLPYDIKVEQLAEELGLADRSFAVDAAIAPGALVDAIDDLVSDRLEGSRLARCADDLRSVVTAHFDAVRGWIDDPDANRAWPEAFAAEAA